jgi:hypothetical protein
MRAPISLALFVFLVGARLAAAGQSQGTPSSGSADAATRHTTYVQGAVIVTVAPEGVANHRVTPPVSGNTVGVSGSAGTFVLPALAVEAEVVLERTISTPQHFSYNWSENYTGQSRDLLLNGNVRWRSRGTRYLEVIGGGGLAVSRFAERSHGLLSDEDRDSAAGSDDDVCAANSRWWRCYAGSSDSESGDWAVIQNEMGPAVRRRARFLFWRE